MRATIGERISAVVFLSVPVLAFWALWPVSTTSQARELVPSLVVAASLVVAPVADEPTDIASSEPITDLSDWNYTADPASPNGKPSFKRRLLSNQPGSHPTSEGPNPRVPWITRPASSGNGNFATVNAAGLAVAAVQALPTASPLAATGPQGAASSTTQGNLQGNATPNTQATIGTTAAMPTLAMLQNIMSSAIQPDIKPSSFQPVRSKWQDRATRLKLGRGATLSNN